MSTSLFNLQRDHIAHLQRAYAEILADQKLDSLAIYSGHASTHFADDHAPPFQTYGHFMHWVGLADVQHSWLIIQPEKRPQLYLYAPADFWHLPTQLPEEPWVTEFDIHLCSDKIAPPLTGKTAVIGDIGRLTSGAQLASKADVQPEPVITALDELRLFKTPYEIACLREANRLAIAGHQAAQAAFMGASAELDIQLAYLGASRQRESNVPYQNIIGLNAHAGVLHYQHYDLSAPKQRYSLLVDAGRRFRGYCADITRTYVGPDAPSVFGELVTAMQGLKDALVKDVAPDVSFVSLHEQMHQQLGEILVANDLFKGTANQAVAEGITRAFCPHGLGHSLGLQVHDVAGLRHPDGTPAPAPEQHPALRLTRTLRPGMVITIEPGLYFIHMLLAPLRNTDLPINWQLVDQLAPCGGIRIEDNVVVTESGFANLTP
ncbi:MULTISPECIES: Xaa-Pro dipeptidase [unclassified Halomonas]|uniref:Xaa-Pro dipeptidase n=1 Tax=unclassified Halomonas TaxID=2609666 RepID=UPI0007D8FA07|nr:MULTISPECIES: Xaa-Pro dipeptidase [unclassified Halomonas]MBT2788567.1 Xaa-Pro dipeptidase [Halomonas sp. ISL-106]MBT2798158.1 Xaa-Pro dipeptidase [Halomonas sp. ISL-104]OAL60711.1 Xaa-Pro dipeptidase [Halomonas sp. ALS9]